MNIKLFYHYLYLNVQIFNKIAETGNPGKSELHYPPKS